MASLKSVKGVTVLHTLEGGKFTYSGFRSAWIRACERAGVKNAHFHDLRAKAATEEESAQEAQKKLGHATESMTAHYRKAHEITRVRPFKKV